MKFKGTDSYISTEDLSMAVNAAIELEKPLLIKGEPGTGKTMLVKALAAEINIPVITTCASEFVEVYVGVGASRIRSLFKEAKSHEKCIVFIDELDAAEPMNEIVEVDEETFDFEM